MIASTYSVGGSEKLSDVDYLQMEALALAKKGHEKALVLVKQYQDLLIKTEGVVKASAKHRKLDNQVRDILYVHIFKKFV